MSLVTFGLGKRSGGGGGGEPLGVSTLIETTIELQDPQQLEIELEIQELTIELCECE